MRIYFVGAHATGKTTLTRFVSRRYGLPMITEVARGVLAELETNFVSLRTDMEAVAAYQKRVFERQMATEHLQEKGFVSDRAFDNLAYAAEHTTSLHNIMYHDGGVEFKKYMDWVKQGFVFFIRPQKELLVEDGVRAGVDWDSVIRIDGMIKLLLEQFHIDYLPINTPSMQERVRAIEFVLGRAVGLSAQSLDEKSVVPKRVVTLLKNT